MKLNLPRRTKRRLPTRIRPGPWLRLTASAVVPTPPATRSLLLNCVLDGESLRSDRYREGLLAI